MSATHSFGTAPRSLRVCASVVGALALLVPVVVGRTDAELVDSASATGSFEALPTLWWASGLDAAGEHGDGVTDAGTDVAARVSWRQGIDIPKGAGVSQVAAGDGFACGIADGRAYCWGDNAHGQLGDGSLDPSTDPVAVATAPNGASALPPDATVTHVSVGAGAACAVADGDVYCWGDNSSGRLGDGTTDASSVPVAVLTDGTGGSAMPAGTATRVAVGGGGPGSTTSFTCALAGGDAYCWGSQENGRLGNGFASASPLTAPTQVLGGFWGGSPVVSAISAGSDSACLVAAGLSYCWGRTVYGQLGDGATDPGVNRTVPMPVQTAPTSALPASAQVTEVAVGATSACALHGGDAYCWGLNLDGQLGADDSHDTAPGSTVARRAVAVARAGTGAAELPVDATVQRIAAAGRLAGPSAWCALAARPAESARAYCWGDGASGQLGQGTSDDHRVPLAVRTHPLSGLPAAVPLGDVAGGEGFTILVAAS